MRRKKSAAMLPKPRPDFFAIGLWQVNFLQCLARKEFKSSFAMNWRQHAQFFLRFKQKHQPMALAEIAVFAHDAGQMQICRCDSPAEFFLRFTARAGIRRFADVCVQLSAARTPQPSIRFLCSLEQQHLIGFIEAVEQRGDFVRQRHTGMWRRIESSGKRFSEYDLLFSVHSAKTDSVPQAPFCKDAVAVPRDAKPFTQISNEV
jgi:hypothetical protein